MKLQDHLPNSTSRISLKVPRIGVNPFSDPIMLQNDYRIQEPKGEASRELIS